MRNQRIMFIMAQKIKCAIETFEYFAEKKSLLMAVYHLHKI